MNPLTRIRRASGVTPANPGEVGAAAVPAAHTPDAEIRGWDPSEDEMPGDMRPSAEVVPAEVRRWRMTPRAHSGSPVTGPPTAGDGALPSAHATPGAPDARRVWDSGTVGQAGYPLPKQEGLYPSPETLVQSRPEVTIAEQPAPVRVRGGSTGEDPTRRSKLPLWLFMRPWDKWAAEGSGVNGYSKIEEGSPLASTPIQDAGDVRDPEPSASGHWAARGQESTGVQPNTVRLLPRSWDELLVQTAITPTPEGSRRAGGWRARG